MQAHANDLRLLVHESFTADKAVPALDLNRLLLTLEELADELDKVSVNYAELLPPVPAHDQTTSITSEEEVVAAEESAVPDGEVECLGSCPPDPIATSEPEEPTPPTPKTKKNKLEPKREKNYSQREDEVLCLAYLNVAKDAIKGANQSKDTYWKRIHAYFHEHKHFVSTRSAGSMMQRWGTIKREVSRFCGIKNQQDRLNESGKTDDDRLSDAMRLFQEVVEHQFNFLHCWVILLLKGLIQRPPDSVARPIGWDAAKKRRSMQQGSESFSACLEVLQQMTMSREATNQAQATNVETMLDVEAKKLAAKMENNVLQREAIEVQRNLLQYKMSRGSQDDQWSEEKIMSLDLTHYTPLQRQYWEEHQIEIMNRRRNRRG
ncbi:hypothetical protein BAE44_0003210 [Dichanthelium oligosanthes]|uniref:Uncharacterized protein n=1 Tax=Dichanthelium oligosanthes TaxID=888268 RepID=A0A1E5WEE7_9POAL|nr:hypothetical protein BAE44_0003210 [Dichanthelium oligosanthes]